MAAKFEMDPDATRSGLTSAGLTRAQAVSRALPVPPRVDNYTAVYMMTLVSMLGAWAAELEALTGQGLAAAAGSTGAVAAAEAASTASLTT